MKKKLGIAETNKAVIEALENASFFDVNREALWIEFVALDIVSNKQKEVMV